MVRSGKALMGPPDPALEHLLPFHMQTAMSLHSTIGLVKQLNASENIGYGGTYTTTDTEWIGTVPIGYADGWHQNFKATGVLVEGKRFPIIGRISMDQLMIRLDQKYPVGTRVTFIGQQGKETITVNDVAHPSHCCVQETDLKYDHCSSHRLARTFDQWDPLMNSTTTFGSYGQEKGELSTIHTAMANWSIPEQFRKQAIESVRLLLMVTAEGSFLGQAFMFDLATVGQKVTDSTYSLIFLVMNINSKTLIRTMLYNGSMSDDVPSTKQLNILRTSTLTPSGEFENETLLKHIVPWQQKTVRIALNMLRFISASVVQPQRFGSHTLKMNKIEQKAMINVLGLLAEEHGFDNIYTHSEYSR
ncbi:unnamed protein product [Rotaria sp. Silwood1]|nr:unnamed protein product [Rotaria sp. Silwood1]